MRNREKTMYDLQCNEVLQVNEFIEITRVPGGWIYEYIKSVGVKHIFIPYNDEFDPYKDPFLKLSTRFRNAWGKLGVGSSNDLVDYTRENKTWADKLADLPGVGRNCILTTRSFLRKIEIETEEGEINGDT